MDSAGDVRARRPLARIGYAALLYAGTTSVALAQIGQLVPVDQVAQVGTAGGIGAPSVAPPPVATGRRDVFERPGRAEHALILGDWLIYPSAFGGVLYDSNVNQSSVGARSSAGLRLVPSVLAETNNGIAKTTVYGMVDGRLYTNQGAGSSDALAVRSGVTEAYQPLPDLRITGQGDYTRQKDLFATLGVTNSLSTLNPTGIGLSPTANPQSYDQISGSVSAQKNFSNAFAILSGSVVDQM